jgi:hypothetical protein
MNNTTHTKESLLAYISKMLDDKRKILDYMEGKTTLESLEKEGIVLENQGQ